MKFRKKPVVIEAVQFFDPGPNGSLPDGVCICGEMGPAYSFRPHIHTLEGPHCITNGDWIITGVKGELYPCKPDIFEATYEPA